jgi:hypothetical protein
VTRSPRTVVLAVFLTVAVTSIWLFFPIFGAWSLLSASRQSGGAAPVFTLALGMLFSAIGLWSAPGGVSTALASLPSMDDGRAGALMAPFNKVWPAAGPLLILLSAFSAWSVRGDFARADSGEWTFCAVAAGVLVLSSAALLSLQGTARTRHKHFGEISFSVDTPDCAPGDEIRARLMSEKRPASVSAVLELYLEGDDRPAKTEPARADGPEEVPGGWICRVTAVMPGQPLPKPEEGGWVLHVKAKGVGGGTFEDDGVIGLRA